MQSTVPTQKLDPARTDPLSGPSQGFTFPTIDYSQHPAFQFPLSESKDINSQIESALTRLDRALGDLRSVNRWRSRNEIRSTFKKEIGPILGELRKLCRQNPAATPTAAEMSLTAVDQLGQQLFQDALYGWEKRYYRPQLSAPSSVRHLTERLEGEGYACIHLPEKAIDQISALLSSDIGELRKRAAKGGNRLEMNFKRESEISRAVSSLLEEVGVQRALSDYAQHELSLLFCNLFFSHEAESWWKGCYDDLGIPTSRLVYAHVDERPDVYKALIYLTPVERSHGPFIFFPGSHRWPRSYSKFCLSKIIDRMLEQHPAGLRQDTLYYRKWFKSPELRKDFASLPKPFQRTSHFGDDILDVSPLSRSLYEKQLAMTSDRGNCIVFDGAMGLHRGGIVEQGARIALQVGFGSAGPIESRSSWMRFLISTGRRVLGDSAFKRIRKTIFKEEF